MPRPRNVFAVRNSTVVTMTPNALKEALTALAAGSAVATDLGKAVSPLAANLDGLTAEQAQALLASLFPPES